MSVGGSLRSTTYGYYFVRHLRSLIGVFLFSVGNLLAQDYTRLLLRASLSGTGCGVAVLVGGGCLRVWLSYDEGCCRVGGDYGEIIKIA